MAIMGMLILFYSHGEQVHLDIGRITNIAFGLTNWCMSLRYKFKLKFDIAFSNLIIWY